MGICASKLKRKKSDEGNESRADDNADATGAVEPLHHSSAMRMDDDEVKMTADGRVVLPGETLPPSTGGQPGAGKNTASASPQLPRQPSSSTSMKMTRAGALCTYQIGSGSQILGDSQNSQPGSRKTTMRMNVARGQATISGGAKRSTLSRTGAGGGTRAHEVSQDEDDEKHFGSSDVEDDEVASRSESYTSDGGEYDDEYDDEDESDDEDIEEKDEDIERELGDAEELDSHRLHCIRDNTKAVDSFSQSQQTDNDWPTHVVDKENVVPNEAPPLAMQSLSSLDEDAVAAMGDLTADGGMHLFMGTSIEKESVDLLAPLPGSTAELAVKRDRPKSEMLPANFLKKNELAYRDHQSTGGSVHSNPGGGEGANRRGSVTGHNRISIRINRQLSKRGLNDDLKSDGKHLSGGKPSAENRFASLRNMNKFEKKDFKRRESQRRTTLGTRKKDRERLLSRVSLGRNHRRSTLATSDANRASKAIEEETEKQQAQTVRNDIIAAPM